MSHYKLLFGFSDSALQIFRGSTTIADIAAALLLIVLLWAFFRRGPSPPPGPLGFPFVGVAWQIPQDKQWLKFDDWIRRFGTFNCSRIDCAGEEPAMIWG